MWVIGMLVCMGLMLGGHAVMNKGHGSHTGHGAAETPPAAPAATPGTAAPRTAPDGAAIEAAPTDAATAARSERMSRPGPE